MNISRNDLHCCDRTEPLSFLSTLRALGITSKANLEKIRKVTAKRAFEAHDLLLRSYYAAKSSPSRTDFSDIVGNAFALQHRLRPSNSRSR
jgi:hypothetical protein